ncbi:ferric transporter ATP-binding subunit [Agrobacterium sp. DSM 25558]|nr:ferric transporter ATP-binding subunit [Agrobacterium sp. DSM 25558]
MKFELRNVTRQFGDRIAVNAVNVEIPQGQMVGIIGRSGGWLGRDAFSDTSFPTPDVEGLTQDEVHALTADPRRYAFHATLKC